MSYPPPPSSPYGSPPATQPLRGRTPRRLGWIFLVLGIVGIVVGAVIVSRESVDTVDEFQRITISAGSGTVNIDRTGKWVIYYEADNVTSSIARVPAFAVLVRAPGGKQVDTNTFGKRSDGKIDKLTYDYGRHQGVAAYEFQASEKGEFQVQVQGGPDVTSEAQIAFGEDIFAGTAAGVIIVLLGVALIVAAIVLLIVGFVKRSRHKKERAAAASGYPPPGGYGPGGFPPPGGFSPPGGFPSG